MLSHPLSTTVGYCSWTLWGAMYMSLGIVQPSAWEKEMIWSGSCSVVSDSLQPSGLYSPWNSPIQNTGMCSLLLLQGIFPTQGLNLGLPHFIAGRFFTGWATREAQEHWSRSPISSRSSRPRNQTGGNFYIQNWINNKVLLYSISFPGSAVVENLPANTGDSRDSRSENPL